MHNSDNLTKSRTVYTARQAEAHLKLDGNFGRPAKQTGATNAVDMVLTVPIFVGTMLVIVQFALICNAALVIQYAAYSAARTARVTLWDADLAFRDLKCVDSVLCEAARLASIGTSIARFSGTLSNPQSIMDSIMRGEVGATDALVTSAAMQRLIAISPADTRLPHRSPSTNPDIWNQTASADYVSKLTAPYTEDEEQPAYRRRVINSKARYAFDVRNTQVTWSILSLNRAAQIATDFGTATNPLDIASSVVGLGTDLNDWVSVGPYVQHNALRIPSLPVEVTVTYWFALQVPFAATVFGNDNDRPGTRKITYTVRLT